MSGLEIRQIHCRTDNYAVLVHDVASGETMVVDTPDAAAISEVLEAEGWKLTHILNTHHHADHTEGNMELKERYGARLLAAAADRERIPGIDKPLRDGDKVEFADHRIDVISVPGHTLGSLAFYFMDEKIVFTGDTLFSLGCGRMFEGDAETMWHSLDMLRHLPEDTLMYCGHEYTLNNGEFALTVEPGNKALRERVEEVRELMRQGRPALPVSIATEKATNPFLRPESAEIRENIGMTGVENYRVFAELRQRKDAF